MHERLIWKATNNKANLTRPSARRRAVWRWKMERGWLGCWRCYAVRRYSSPRFSAPHDRAKLRARPSPIRSRSPPAAATIACCSCEAVTEVAENYHPVDGHRKHIHPADKRRPRQTHAPYRYTRSYFHVTQKTYSFQILSKTYSKTYISAKVVLKYHFLCRCPL